MRNIDPYYFEVFGRSSNFFIFNSKIIPVMKLVTCCILVLHLLDTVFNKGIIGRTKNLIVYLILIFKKKLLYDILSCNTN
jgi:hypothetical protein